MLRWNLHWVESRPEENCFVVAKTLRSAEKHDESIADVESGGCTASLVKPIPPEVLEEAWAQEEKNTERTYDFFSALQGRRGYADDGLLKMLGARLKYQDCAKVAILDGKSYRTAGFEETYVGKPSLIGTCEELLTLVGGLPPGTWLYRGHRISTWALQCSLDRPPYTVSRGIVKRGE